MSIVASYLTEDDRAGWRAYVDAHPRSTLFHDLRWSAAVAAGYQYQNKHLIARRVGAIAGVLPLTFVNAPLLGRSLISSAFAVGGGVLADDNDAASALAQRALELGNELGVNYIELRGGDCVGEGFAEKADIYATFEKELPLDKAEILSSLPKRRRAEVKKALASEESGDLAIRTGASIEEFYAIYRRSLRNLGTPAMPKKFLTALKEEFGEEAEISIVDHCHTPVAGLLTFWRPDRVMPYYVGAIENARAVRAYDFLYFDLMRRAVDRGVKIFDFGRSKIGSTHFATKTYWGFEPKLVSYQIGLVRANNLPNVNPNNPKFAAFVSLWKRTPLPIANRLGPALARNFA